MQIAIDKRERPQQAIMAIKMAKSGGTWRYQGGIYPIKSFSENAYRVTLELDGCFYG